MNERTKYVKDFFNQTEIYLNKNTGILIRVEIVESFLSKLENQEIIDIGCGDGSISLPYLKQGNNVTFVDISENMLKKVSLKIENNTEFQKGKASFLNIDLDKVLFEKKFDVVICIGVLAHTESMEITMNKIASLMKPNSIAIIQLTNNDKLFGKLLNFYTRIRNTSGYKSNKTSLKDFYKYSSINGLTVCGHLSYLQLFLGLGQLPTIIKYKIQKFSIKHQRIMGFFCTESVFKLIKK